MFQKFKYLIPLLLLFATHAEAAGVKLSAINNGGAINTSTDQCVAVRSGTTDELVTLAASAGTDTTNASNISSGSLAYARLPALLANQVLGALTATTPSGLSVPSCSSTNNVLQWTAGGGFGCATITPGTGTVTSVSVTTANGVSGSVATATTTPAITLTLGAITPTSVNSVVISGSSTPTLAVTGTTTVSGSNTGDQVTPVNTTSTASNYFTAYNSATGAFTKAQPAFTDISGNLTLAQFPSIANNTALGNVSGGSAVPVALTTTQLTTLVNNFSSTLSGAAPLSGGGTTNFLRADGTWAAPGGTGTVTSIATTSPITGGTITTTGTIACATCATTTNGGALSGTAPIAVSVSGVISGGGLGTVTGALKGNGSGTITQAACADLSNGATGCSTTVGTSATVNTGTSGATIPLNNGSNTASGSNIQSGSYAVTGTTLPTQAAGTLGLAGTATKPTLGANSEGDVFLTAAGGFNIIGQGSSNDFTIFNKSGTSTCTIATGTTTMNCVGLQVNGSNVSTTTGTVTSIATTSPIAGGTITGTGTITCTTCATTTNGGALTATSPMAISAGGVISINAVVGGTYRGDATVTAQTIVLVQYAPYGMTINTLKNLGTVTGTVTGDLKINGTNVTGCNGLALTSTPAASTSCTAANTVAAGDLITFVTSSPTALTGLLAFSMIATRS